MAANTHSTKLVASSSQYFSITDASQTGLDITGDITIAAWVNISSAPGNYSIVAKHDGSLNEFGYRFFYKDSGGTKELAFVAYDASANTSDCRVNQDIGTGTWHHIAVKWDASAETAEFFVDGVSIGSATDTGTTSINSNSARFAIGAVPNDSGGTSAVDYFDGNVDNIMVYDTLLTDAQVQDLMFTDSPSATNLQGHWKFDNDATDSSSNGNDLTANGSPTFVVDQPFFPQDFENFADGDIDSQGGWDSPEGKLAVGNYTPYAGSKNVRITYDTTPFGANRDFGPLTGTGHLYWAVKIGTKSGITGGGLEFRIKDGSTQLWEVQFTSTDIEIDEGAATLVSDYTEGIYYIIDFEYDLDNNQARARAYDTNTGSWGSYTAWQSNTASEINTLGVYGGSVSGSVFAYFDDLDDTDYTSTAYTLSISDSITLNDTIKKTTGKGLTDNPSIADDMVKTSGKGIDDTSAISDSVANGSGKVNDDTVSIADSIQKEYEKIINIYDVIETQVSDYGVPLVYVQQIYNSHPCAQTFTPETTHNIIKVNVIMRRVGDIAGTITVAIKATDGNGKPTGSDLTSSTVAVTNVPTTRGWVSFTLSPYEVQASTKYAIVFSTSEGSSAEFEYIEWKMTNPPTNGEEYDGGTGYVSDDGGSTWTSLGNDDFIFTEYSPGVNLPVSDTIAKAPAKALADNPSLADDLVKAMTSAQSDTTSISDAIKNSIGKSIADNPSISDSIAHSIGKVLNDTAAIADQRISIVAKYIDDSVTTSDTIKTGDQFTQQLVDTIGIADATIRSVGKTIENSIPLSDSVQRTVAFLLQLINAVSLADTIAKTTGKTLDDTLTASDETTKTVTKKISDTAGISDQTSEDKGASQTLQDTVTTSDSLKKDTGKNITDTPALSDSIGKTAGKDIQDSTGVSDSVEKTAGKNIDDSTALDDSVNAILTIHQAIVDTVSLDDALANAIDTLLTDSVLIQDDVQKTISKTLADDVSVADQIQKEIRTAVADSLTIADSLAKEYNLTISDAVQVADSVLTSKIQRILKEVLLRSQRRSGPIATTKNKNKAVARNDKNNTILRSDI